MESEKVMDWAASRAEHKAGLQSPPGPGHYGIHRQDGIPIVRLCSGGLCAFYLYLSNYCRLPAILEIGVTDFLFGTEWAGKQEKFGILPFILTSVAGTAGAVLVGVPIGCDAVSGQGSAAQGG